MRTAPPPRVHSLPHILFILLTQYECEKTTHTHTIPHHQTKTKLRFTRPAVRELPLPLSSGDLKVFNHPSPPRHTIPTPPCPELGTPKLWSLHWSQMKPATAPLGSQTAQILPAQHLYPGWAARSVLCIIKKHEICTGSSHVLHSADPLAFLLFTPHLCDTPEPLF